jgi:hypothetical protein
MMIMQYYYNKLAVNAVLHTLVVSCVLQQSAAVQTAETLRLNKTEKK